MGSQALKRVKPETCSGKSRTETRTQQMNPLFSRAVCLALLAVSLTAALPALDGVVPEQVLTQKAGDQADIDEDYKIWGDEDDSQIKDEVCNADNKEGIDEKTSDAGGKDALAGNKEVTADVTKQAKEDAAEAEKVTVEEQTATPLEVLRTEIEAFGKKGIGADGKTYQQEYDAEKKKEDAIKAKKAAKEAAKLAKEEKETKAEEVKDDAILGNLFNHHEDDEDDA